MEKLLLILISMFAFAYTYTYRKEFLCVYPIIYLMYRIYSSFNEGVLNRYVILIFESGAIGWILATTYICTLYSAKHFQSKARN